jgi:hypothetical protein
MKTCFFILTVLYLLWKKIEHAFHSLLQGIISLAIMLTRSKAAAAKLSVKVEPELLPQKKPEKNPKQKKTSSVADLNEMLNKLNCKRDEVIIRIHELEYRSTSPDFDKFHLYFMNNIMNAQVTYLRDPSNIKLAKQEIQNLINPMVRLCNHNSKGALKHEYGNSNDIYTHPCYVSLKLLYKYSCDVTKTREDIYRDFAHIQDFAKYWGISSRICIGLYWALYGKQDRDTCYLMCVKCKHIAPSENW